MRNLVASNATRRRGRRCVQRLVRGEIDPATFAGASGRPRSHDIGRRNAEKLGGIKRIKD